MRHDKRNTKQENYCEDYITRSNIICNCQSVIGDYIFNIGMNDVMGKIKKINMLSGADHLEDLCVHFSNSIDYEIM